MKRKAGIFVLILLAANFFMACNFAPEGNAWDYEKVEPWENYKSEILDIAPGKMYKGYGYLAQNNGYGTHREWKFKNNTEETVTCKFAEKFYQSHSRSYVYVDLDTIENSKDGFEVPAGKELHISVYSDWSVSSGSEQFYGFFLACH